MKSLVAIQSELKCNKSQYNSFGKYHYRSLEDIFEAVKPLLAKYESSLVISDEIVEVSGRVYVKATAKFTDKDGTSEIVTAYARESLEKKGMDDSQVTGATSSYARKYALNGLFMIDDTKDADTDEAKNESDARAKKQDRVKTAEVEKQYIDNKKIDALTAKCEADGVSPMIIFDKCNVENFSKITEKQFAWICANWTKEFVNGK